MNPLGPLPASNSKQFSLNKLDWKKIGRLSLTQAAGLAVTVLPLLNGYTYVIHGVDFTPLVTMVVGLAAEGARRFAAGKS
jgi:hypothetical protein